MSDDLLGQATRALREETAASEEAAPFTRARVMASLHRNKRRRRFHFAALVPIAAVLAGSTALASWGSKVGWKNVLAVASLEQPTVAERTVPKLMPRGSTRSARLVTLAAAEEPTAAPAVEVAPPTVAEPVPPEPVKPSFRSSPAPSVSSEAPKPDPELTLYREAHRAHFASRDAASALARWEAYLSRAPRGRFAVEASYNRALCLVRLGRTAEAERALEPFARGAFGSYRRDEASALLDALGRPH